MGWFGNAVDESFRLGRISQTQRACSCGNDSVGNRTVSNYANISPLPESVEFATTPADSLEPEQQNSLLATAIVIGPQERRRQAKSRLSHQVDNAIRMALNKTRLHSMGGQVSRIHPMLRNQKNWAASRYWLYYTLNQRLGRKPRSGSEWNLEEVERATELLPILVDELVAKITERKTGRYF